eukprot:COSAG02_NODE_24618_length_682_cov_1.245283_2_plen_109_part_01
MEDASKLVEGGTLTGKALDDACSNLKTIDGRVTSLKSIRDRKMVSIYTALESFYPEIAGSVDTASQKHKPISLHKLALPGDLLTGTMDASKSTKLMADILQVCLMQLK